MRRRGRRDARDLPHEVEELGEGGVLAAEHEPVPGPALLEGERVALGHVLDERVRPPAVGGAHEPGQPAVQVVGDHPRDDVAVGHVAGAVDDARVEGDDVLAPGRRLPRHGVGAGLGPLVAVAEGRPGVGPLRVEGARARGAEGHERGRVDEPGPRGPGRRQRVHEPADVHRLEALGVRHPDLHERGHVDDRLAALGGARHREGVGDVPGGHLDSLRQPLEAARGAREHAQERGRAPRGGGPRCARETRSRR